MVAHFFESKYAIFNDFTVFSNDVNLLLLLLKYACFGLLCHFAADTPESLC